MSPPFLDIDLSTFRLEFQTPSATGWESSVSLFPLLVIRSSFVWTRDIPTWMGYIYSSDNTPFSFRLDFFFFGEFLFFSSFIRGIEEIGLLYFAIFAGETRSSKRVRKWSKFDKVSRTTRFYPPLGKFESHRIWSNFAKKYFHENCASHENGIETGRWRKLFSPFQRASLSSRLNGFFFPASWRSKRVLELPFPPFNRERTKFPFLTNTSVNLSSAALKGSASFAYSRVVWISRYQVSRNFFFF